MTKPTFISRADQTRVTEVLSDAYSRTMPCDETEPFEKIKPRQIEDLSFPVAELQEVEWEVHDGVNGPHTLLKETESSTSICGECGGEGWKDQHGDTTCRECGLILNDTPETVPRDGYSWHRGGNTEVGTFGVFFNDGTGGKAALNTARQNSGNADNGPDQAQAQT